jgi:ABC-type antimicrobial peptide transport system permease subunit
MIGIGLAQLFFLLICRLLFPPFPGSMLLPIAVIAIDLAGAALVAFVSTALPAWRLVRLNLAAALARGTP